MYGLTKIEAGLYEHSSGTLIVRTGGWEGPRSKQLQRWEHAERAEVGLSIIGFELYPTLREAAAALEATA